MRDFDEVYIDLPPTLPFADAAILGPQADAVILVIRANATAWTVTDALEHLAGAPVIGSVLNGAERSAESYFKAYERPVRR